MALQGRFTEAVDVSGEAVAGYRELLTMSKLFGLIPGMQQSPVHLTESGKLREEARMVLHSHAVYLAEAGRPAEAEAALREIAQL